jgi:hypothetical protein
MFTAGVFSAHVEAFYAANIYEYCELIFKGFHCGACSFLIYMFYFYINICAYHLPITYCIPKAGAYF